MRWISLLLILFLLPLLMTKAFVQRTKYENGLYFTTALYGLRGKKIRRLKRQAMQEQTPPRIETIYGPIRISQPPRVCETCQGRGLVRCPVCQGRGAVPQTGNNKKNILPPKLEKSKWTSVEIRNGHRQHTVVETRGSRKRNNLECRIINICGNVKDTWIPADELKDKELWRKGWTTLDEIQRADRGALKDAKRCFRCKGRKVINCIECDGKGTIPNYEPLHN